MAKQSSQICTTEKNELVGRFVADVLRNRVTAVIKLKHAFLTSRAKKVCCKRNVDLIDELHAMDADDNNTTLETFGIEINSWLSTRDPVKEVPFQPDLRLCNNIDADDMNLDIPKVIKLPYTARVDPDDFQWNLEPYRNEDDSEEGNAWGDIQLASAKLREDAKTLTKVAYKSIARKTSWASIEKNCPELAPYIDLTADNEPCPAELADMASCMRGKDDC